MICFGDICIPFIEISLRFTPLMGCGGTEATDLDLVLFLNLVCLANRVWAFFYFTTF